MRGDALSVTFLGTGTLTVTVRSTGTGAQGCFALKDASGNYIAAASRNNEDGDVTIEGANGTYYMVTGGFTTYTFNITQSGTYTVSQFEDGTYSGALRVSALTGEADEYVLYYNTHLLADDDDDDDDIDLESESEYRLDGILFQGDKEFEISGEMEIESEGDENEQEFSMTASDSLGNMIRLEQEFSTETGEIEEELNYEVYILGVRVYSFSLEFETDEDGEELVVRSNTLGVDEIDELFGTEIRYSRGVNAEGNKCVKVDIMKSVAGVKLRAGLDVYYIADAETGELTIGYTARGGADWNDLYEALFGAEEAPAEGTQTA